MEETTTAAHDARRIAAREMAESIARERAERLVADDGRAPATLEDVLLRLDDARQALARPDGERQALLRVDALARDLAAVIRRMRAAGGSTALGPAAAPATAAP